MNTTYRCRVIGGIIITIFKLNRMTDIAYVRAFEKKRDVLCGLIKFLLRDKVTVTEPGSIRAGLFRIATELTRRYGGLVMKKWYGEEYKFSVEVTGFFKR